MPGQRHNKPTSTVLGQGYMRSLGVICNIYFWQNDRGLLLTPAVTRRWNGAPNKSQHTKLTLEKNILPPLLLGFEHATFRSRVQRSYQQDIPTPPPSPGKVGRGGEGSLIWTGETGTSNLSHNTLSVSVREW